MDVSPSDSGTVEVNGNVLDSFPATLTFANSETVSIKAVPDSKYEFVVWDGSLSGNDNPVDLTMTCSKKINANFYRPIYTLSINTNGNGTTTPSVGNHSYYKGTDVSITAIPDNGWEFVGWTDDTIQSENATIVITVDSNKTLAADFSQIMRTLTIEVNGNGSTNPKAGQYIYSIGTEVSIVATPDEGWQFDSWSGDTFENEPNNTLIMDSDKTIVANFFVIEANLFEKNYNWWLICGVISTAFIIGGVAWFFTKRHKKGTF